MSTILTRASISGKANADRGSTPALSTITSTRPHLARAASTNATTSARSVTSSFPVAPVHPAASISAAIAPSRSVRRAPGVIVGPGGGGRAAIRTRGRFDIPPRRQSAAPGGRR